MHVADGILSPQVCLATGLAAAGAVGFSLHKLKNSLTDRVVPLTGMMASLVFAGQMVNFPIGVPGVSGHLLGGVLAAVMLGPWAGCVAVALVLFVQLALFNDGGWTALGANVLNMAVVGSWGGYAVYAAIRNLCGNRFPGVVIGSVVAAWLSVLAGAALFCLEFRLSGHPDISNYSHIFLLMTLFHSAIGVGEALITGSVVGFVQRQRPDLLYQVFPERRVLPGIGRAVAAGLVAALAVAAFLAPFASTYDDGLNAIAGQNFPDLEQSAAPLLNDGYDIPAFGEQWRRISISCAGIGGTLAVMSVALLLGFLYRPVLKGGETEHGA